MDRCSVGLFGIILCVVGAWAQTIPEDFPRFIAPGREDELSALRDLYWLHYPGAGPKATLWDEWLTAPSLWPAVASDGQALRFREEWARTLSGRLIDEEGYVATHQHASIAHQRGWPFPFWMQGGPSAWGWHFSLAGVPDGWHGTEVRDASGWTIDGGEDAGIDELAWRATISAPSAWITAPAMRVDVLQSPFVQLRWSARRLGNARPYLAWTTEAQPEFDEERRMYFDPIESDEMGYTMLPMYRHPGWTGIVTGLRIGFEHAKPGATVGIQAMFTQYDTRHNINNANFVRGCAKYVLWTGDINFLRGQITRMRRALRYAIDEFHIASEGVVRVDWVGHDGRTGIHRDGDGNKTLLYGRGVGNNYWDLLPFGHKDTYATIQLYDALRRMAALERAIAGAPGWNLPAGIETLDAEALERHADAMKRAGNAMFWNEGTGRFHAGIDIEGNSYDYGFTFLNLEAIYYSFATDQHARSILDWIAGTRIVEDDTARGDDIYHWRFGPRATTKRNIDYYGWFWSNPESIAWGGQVQDGGGVLGFSLHDLMARLRVLGADDTWTRLQEVLAWFDDVQEAGGYRAYYETQEGTLQGGGTAGGLGCDKEFFESVLVPQIMLEGFLGFEPNYEGFALNPALPTAWPSLSVDRILLRDVVYSIEVASDSIAITVEEVWNPARKVELVQLPPGNWQSGEITYRDEYPLEILDGAEVELHRR